MKPLYHYPLISRIIAALLLFLLPASDAFAQGSACDLACIGTLDFPLSVSISEDCDVTLVREQFLPAPMSCPGDKLLTARDSFNILVAEGVNEITFSTVDLIEQALSVEITDVATGTICTGFVHLEDNRPPVLSNCGAVVVNCTVDLDPAVFGSPTAVDNCGTEVDLSFTQQVAERNCLTDTVAVITRLWTAADANQQSSFCSQRITVLRGEVDDVVFPADLTLPSCVTTSADPAATGRPTLDGLPVMPNSYCGFELSFQDDTLAICGAADRRITRQWTVSESCSGFSRTVPQVISIRDQQGPVIACPVNPVVFPADAGFCTATVNLPLLAATDNCSGIAQRSVSTSYGATNFTPYPGVEPGLHSVTYTVTDSCGNATNCSFPIQVVDEQLPFVVSEDQLIVSISNAGLAEVPATDFDNGSGDNCQGAVYFKTRRMTVGGCDFANGDDAPALAGQQEYFDDRIRFCCADAAEDSILVILRVYEVDPGPGPVDPARETEGGDLNGHFTDGMLSVIVRDAAAPVFLNCPLGATISCAVPTDNLAMFGNPTVMDHCGYELTETENVSISDCGTGSIVRSWTATDAAGNTRNCTQTITLVNNQPLTASGIEWPAPYTVTNQCDATFPVNSLPVGSRSPVITAEVCGNVGISHTDQLFTTSAGGCFKILRKWEVIDWCFFDAASPGAGGRFTYTQILKSENNEAPVISCPNDTVVGVNAGNCSAASILLPTATATDCSTTISLTNDSPFANGADASGSYPIGQTVVTFFAADGCGNISSCITTISVNDDLAPAPICINGLSTPLSPGPGGASATVPAVNFVQSIPNDSCGGGVAPVITLRRQGDGTTGVPTATSLTFSCADIGTVAVEVWAGDAAGNADFCLTEIAIQDNFSHCGTGPGEEEDDDNEGIGTIAGGIFTDDGREVENAQVQLMGGASSEQNTAIDGSYAFADMPLNTTYLLRPTKTDAVLNGLSTFDIVLINRHILGSTPLPNPYRILAADVNRSGSVTTLDIIQLRRLILGLDETLPGGAPTWRFIDASFTFPDPADPWATYLPEQYSINGLNGDMMHADFIGIKIGDVNGSGVVNSFGLQAGGGGTQNRGRSAKQDLTLTLPARELAAGEETTLTFTADYLNSWLGYQFTLEFTAGAVEILEVIPGNDIPNLYAENFGRIDNRNGLLTTAWYEFDEPLTQSGEVDAISGPRTG